MSLEIRRAGNLIEIVGGAAFEPLLASRLRYWHKTFYNGRELYARQRWQKDQERAQALGAPYDPAYQKFNPKFESNLVSLYHVVGANLACPAGFKSAITSTLDSSGVPWTFRDLRSKQLPPADFARLLELGPIQFKFRQDDVLATIDASEGGVIVMPTGHGKSFIAKLICSIYPKSNIILISPGLDTIRGLFAALRQTVPDLGIVGDGKYQPDQRVTLCSADSLHKSYFERADLILFDEVHTAAERKVVQNLSRFTEAKFIGFTATHNCRGDGADAVIEGIFGPVLLNVDYAEAVDHGAVSPIKVLMVEVPPTSAYNNDKEGTAWTRWAYWRNDHRNKVIAQAIAELVPLHITQPDPQTLVMVETVDHAFELRKFLADYALVYAEPTDKEKWEQRRQQFTNRGLWRPGELTVTDKIRDSLRRQFEAGTLKRAISTFCWSTGVDFVSLPVLVRADGTDSPILNGQVPGRLSRLHGGKPFGLLIDFVDRFDPKALRKSQGRMKDYRGRGWQVEMVRTQTSAPSLAV